MSVRRANRSVIEERGWTSGTDIEDTVARILSMSWAPGDVQQQHRVLGYRLDFAWSAIKVAIEVDGPMHRGSPDAALRDARRDAELRHLGWVVLRVDADTCSFKHSGPLPPAPFRSSIY